MSLVDVVVGGLRVRVDCEVPDLTPAHLRGAFGGHAVAPRGRVGAQLRVAAAPPPRAWREPARLGPRAAAALAPLPPRLRVTPARRRELEEGLAALLAPVAARAEVALADAAEPVAFPWGNGAFVGDLARPAGTLFLPRWRAPRDLTPPLRNAHGLLLAAAALARGGLLIHSGAVVVGGAAWLLVGRSGAGKSTLSRRAGGAALSDDGVLVLPRRGGRFAAVATPLNQIGGRGARRGPVPVAGVLLLRQARSTRLLPVPPAAALAEIVSRHLHFLALVPPRLAVRALRNAAALLATAPSFRLSFTRDADVGPALRAAGLADAPPRRRLRSTAGA